MSYINNNCMAEVKNLIHSASMPLHITDQLTPHPLNAPDNFSVSAVTDKVTVNNRPSPSAIYDNITQKSNFPSKE